MPADPVEGERDRGVEPAQTEDPTVFIRTGKRFALGYFLVGCCFGVGAVFTSGVFRIVLIVPAVFFLLVAAWCGFVYGLLGAGFKFAERVSTEGGLPEIPASKQREMLDQMFPQPTPSLKDRLLGRKTDGQPVADPANETEVLEWARAHQVAFPSRQSRKRSIDLRLAPESLPRIAALLGSSDGELLMTASMALMYNGARVDSDATATEDPTIYRVTLPDGSVLTVPAEST